LQVKKKRSINEAWRGRFVRPAGSGIAATRHFGYTFDASGAPSGNFVETQTLTVSANLKT
jgi:hypothetical protein